jgi:hypothetical protein
MDPEEGSNRRPVPATGNRVALAASTRAEDMSMEQIARRFSRTGAVADPLPTAPPAAAPDRPLVWQEEDGGVVFDLEHMEVDHPYPFEFDGDSVVAFIRSDGSLDLFERA